MFLLKILIFFHCYGSPSVMVERMKSKIMCIVHYVYCILNISILYILLAVLFIHNTINLQGKVANDLLQMMYIALYIVHVTHGNTYHV